MNRLTPAVIILLIPFCLSSCSLFKPGTRRKGKNYERATQAADTGHASKYTIHSILPQPDTIITAIPTNADTTGAVKQLIAKLNPIWKSRIDYKTFSGKAKVRFTGPDDDKEFTAHFRIRKDSVIWVNVTFDGLPAARLLITPDSIFLLNTFQKEITRMPLSQAAKILPTKVDFASLQNLVVGEPLRDGTITDATSAGGLWAIRAEDSSYIQQITFSEADSTIRTGQLRTRKPNGPQAVIAYSGYELIDNRKVSTSRTLNIQNGNDVYLLDMNFSKTDFDEPLDYPFTIPKNYTEKK